MAPGGGAESPSWGPQIDPFGGFTEGGGSDTSRILVHLVNKRVSVRIPPPTPTETRILELLALGRTGREIAKSLWISESGVRYHIGNLLAKVQVTNAAALVARAVTLGWLNCATWPPRAVGEGLESAGVAR